MRHLIDPLDFTREEVDNLLDLADRIMEKYQTDYPKGGARFDIQILDLGHMGQEWDG